MIHTTLTTTAKWLLPVLLLVFNVPVAQGKCTASDANGHPAMRFGQRRLSIPGHAIIRDACDVARWQAFDWSAYELKTVVIDPGHGGKDEGTSAPDGTQEKHIALSIAKRLGTYIQTNHPGVQVVYTRKSDVFIPLKKRAEIANAKKADLFISIHCNAFKKTYVRGTETYVMGLQRESENLEVIKRENDVVLLEEDYEDDYEEYGVNESSPLYDILVNSYKNAHLEQSLSLASSVDKYFVEGGQKSRGVHQADFLVLRRTAMPSILVETGYLSNNTDRALLTSEKGQAQIANRIYRAFDDYKAASEKPRGGKAVFVLEAAPPPPPETGAETSEATAPEPLPEFFIVLNHPEENVDFTEDKWKPLANRVIIRPSIDGRKSYLLGGFGQDYDLALSHMAEYRKTGFGNCHLIALRQGDEVRLDKALELIGN